MLKKILWTVPVLAIGMAIGGLTLPSVFADTNASSTAHTNGNGQAQQMMQGVWNSSQGRSMIQGCENFMNSYSGQK